MRFTAMLLMAFVGALFAASPRASAHGGEYLLAKVAFSGHGVVQVEITADYGGANPMIDTEEAAVEAVSSVLQVRMMGAPQPLSAFSKPRFEKRAQFDPTSPYAALPPDGPDAKPHQLITGIWSWKPSTEALTFEIPHGDPENVALWTIDERLPQRQPRWLYLIAGDFTPAIPVPRSALDGLPKAMGIGFAALCLVGGPAAWWSRRRGRKLPDNLVEAS